MNLPSIERGKCDFVTLLPSPMKTIANGARLPLLHLPLVQACQTKPFPNKDVKERELLLLCPDGKIWSTNHAYIFF